MDPVVHFELPCDDRLRITRFYETAFGWQMQMLGEEMGNYVLATTALADVQADVPAGAINGGIFTRQPGMPEQHPSVVIGVADIRQSMARVATAGGKVLGEPMDIPGVGAYVAFMDTEGNRLSMLQSLPPAARR
jgi:predicted enzyme related to lactoylglutathione lyase